MVVRLDLEPLPAAGEKADRKADGEAGGKAPGPLLRTFTDDENLTWTALNASGSLLAATGPAANRVRIWETRTGRERQSVFWFGVTPGPVALSPDGRLLVLGSPGRNLRLVDLRTGTTIAGLSGRRVVAVRTVSFEMNGSHLIVVDTDGGRRRVRRTESPPEPKVPALTGEPRILSHPRAVHSVSFSPDGSRLVTNDNTVNVWQLLTEELAGTFGRAGSLADAVWSPDGTLIAHTRDLVVIALIDPDTGHEIRHIDCRHLGVSALAFNADGTRLAGWLGDHTVGIWDPATGREVRRRLDARQPPVSIGPDLLAFSPDGTRLAKGTGDGTADVHLWNLVTGTLQRLAGHESSVGPVAFHPSGDRLATGSRDRFVLLWDVATGELLREAGEHSGEIRALAFSPDGTWLATSDMTGEVTLRDPATGTPIHRVPGHTGGVLSLAFSPDGTRLATAGIDTTVLLHTLPRH